jgi:hypothetical protein
MLSVETRVVAPKLVTQNRQACMSSVVFFIKKPLFCTVENRPSRVSKQGVHEWRYSDDSSPCVNH